MSKRLVVFNHKGGVSKTTTVFNIGWVLAKNHNVLIVDADPQCNLSMLMLGDNFESYYTEKSTKLQNIKDGVSAAFSGKPSPIQAVSCNSSARSPNLFLLAGHANLSEYDAALTFAQTSNNAITTLQNLPGAFQELLRLTEDKYSINFTIIDLNPSLSATNQNLFLNSDAFIIPTNPDPFSLMAIQTLKSILPRWAEWKRNTADIFSESVYPLRKGIPKFSGSLVQRFNIRNGKAAKPYRDNIEEIKSLISGDFFKKLKSYDMTFSEECYSQSLKINRYCLGEVPDFQGLLPKAYDASVPIFELTDDEIGEIGIVLEGMKAKIKTFHSMFQGIANELVSILAYA